MKELWKDITGYEGLYQVSNTGKVRSINRTIIDSNGNKQKWKSHIFIGKVNNSGYLTVCLRKCGKRKGFLIHRLVATAFIENPTNLPYVNHKDEIKTNNNVENLEWCSESYNCRYGKRNLLMIEKKRKPVLQLSVDGDLINRFEVLNDASRITGINAAHICDVCKGKRKLAGGYVWKYAPGIL